MENFKIDFVGAEPQQFSKPYGSLFGSPGRSSAFSVVKKSHTSPSTSFKTNPTPLNALWIRQDHKYYDWTRWNTKPVACSNIISESNENNLLLEWTRSLLAEASTISTAFQKNFYSPWTRVMSPIFELKKGVNAMEISRKLIVSPAYAQEAKILKSDTTVSHCNSSESHEADSHDSHRIGFYTKRERQERIAKYKAKLQRWMKGENKNKDRYVLRSKIAKQKPRIGGKFAKKSDPLPHNANQKHKVGGN